MCFLYKARKRLRQFLLLFGNYQFQKLDYPAKALMGMNFRHVPRDKVLSIIRARDQVSVDEVYRHPILPVDVYTLAKI